MTNKELIYKKLIQLNYTNGIDTKTLSSLINLSRANVSHELNQLCREGKLRKSPTRPVLYFINDSSKTNKKPQLDLLSENNISLKAAIEQAKAAILYPPKGMNCLILGETGVGKSMFASLIYEYALEMEIKSPTSPFIIFNCADYTNNSQLLTSQLFGVKKGAYTGAENDKPGLIEQANGGILFLDEIHRLPPEGQEALFIFLDTAKFRRLGDSEVRTSDVLIIAATTENPDSALLNTFTRRIPITITIPSLKDRTLEERLYLIKSFFKSESIRLNKEVYVSLNSLRALLSYNCPNNIGQLKSDVQLLCAKAYSEFLTKAKRDVRISSPQLPPYIKEGLYKEKEHRVLWNKLMGEEVEFFRFPGSNNLDDLFLSTSNNNIYNFLEKKLELLQSQHISYIDIEHILEKDIAKHFQNNISGISDENSRKNLLSIIDLDILECFEEMIKFILNNLDVTFDDNLYTAFALHISTLINRINSGKSIINSNLNKIRDLYPNEFSIACEAKKIIENHIHSSIPIDEAGYITLFLLPYNTFNNKLDDKVKVILIAHGDSTASSMAQVANKLLSDDYVIPINAPIDVPPSKILERLRIIIESNPSNKGYLLLVDMGSLTTFADVIEKEFHVNIKVISLVSTLHVLEATRKALLGFSLDDIFNDVLMVNSYIEIHKNVNKSNEENKLLIVTACSTGEGGAIAIKNFLSTNLRFDKKLVEFATLNCFDERFFIEKLATLQRKNKLLCVVSSFPINIEIKHYTMNEVFNSAILNEIQENIDFETALINIPLILKESISFTDTNELFKDIMNFLNFVKTKLELTISNERTVGLILHLAFVINRYKNGTTPIEYHPQEYNVYNNTVAYEAIKENLIFLNNKYNIDISNDEIYHLVELLCSTY